MARQQDMSTPKILTYRQLEARLIRARCDRPQYDRDPAAVLLKTALVKKYGIAGIDDLRLCGAVKAVSSKEAGVRIRWEGTPSFVENPTSIDLARVYAASDGDTAYWIQPTPINRSSRRIWKRYIRMLTPHRTGDPVTDNDTTVYRIQRGVATRAPVFTAGSTLGLGVWRLPPATHRATSLKNWAEGDDVRGEHTSRKRWIGFPKYMSRCRRFASVLRERLAETDAIIVLSSPNAHSGGCELIVCLPPTRTRDSTLLRVVIAMHTEESVKHFGINREWGKRHSQYVGREQDERAAVAFRWKCGKEAIEGITEWVLNATYIPGL